MPNHTLDFRISQVEQQLEDPDNVKNKLDAQNVWEWIQKYRPNVGGETRNFDLIPFWKEFYLDDHQRKGALCGRQVYKSTAATDHLAFIPTTGTFRAAGYVVHDPDSLEAFSTERVREGTFLANPQLASFLPHGRANVKTIRLTNHSRIYFRHSQHNYAKVEGLTLWILILDEAQKQDLTKLRVAMHTIRAKKGPLIMFGIGGEEGSPWHDLIMREADIYDWDYDDKSDYIDDTTKRVWPLQGWRNKLNYDNTGKITNTPDELGRILAGKLRLVHSATSGVATYKMYHFPQEIFPEIPLTISDCTKYKMEIQDAVEYQEIHESEDIFQAHCKGWFYAARGRPLTLEMIRKCYDSKIGFLTPNQIKQLKEQHQNSLTVTAGIDWGSNKSGKSYTVFTVLLCFKKTAYEPAHYQIAYQKKFTVERSDYEEAMDILPLITQYHVDHTCADLGFGKSGVKVLQEGVPTAGIKGLGQGRVKGVFTLGNLLEETHTYQMQAEMDEKKLGIKNPHLSVHKTERVDALVQVIKSTIPDPTDPTNKELATPKLVIPYENPHDVDSLEQGLLKIKRADLEEDTLGKKSEGDKRQKPEKLYEHYWDEVSALIHAFIADENYSPGSYKMSVVKKRF